MWGVCLSATRPVWFLWSCCHKSTGGVFVVVVVWDRPSSGQTVPCAHVRNKQVSKVHRAAHASRPLTSHSHVLVGAAPADPVMAHAEWVFVSTETTAGVLVCKQQGGERVGGKEGGD